MLWSRAGPATRVCWPGRRRCAAPLGAEAVGVLISSLFAWVMYPANPIMLRRFRQPVARARAGAGKPPAGPAAAAPLSSPNEDRPPAVLRLGRPGIPLQSVYERAIERFEVMDGPATTRSGWPSTTSSSFSVCPSVHMMATMAAARTKRLRIGTAVSLAPFYHPLRLAEEVALLDMLSGGRVNWGAGRGFSRVEFEAFGVPVEESAARFRETVDVVLRRLERGAAAATRASSSASTASRCCRSRCSSRIRRCGWRRPRRARSTGQPGAASRS